MPRPAAAQGGNATNYAYDSQNRLIQVSDKDNHPIARYGYDPFDRRIWKEAYRNKDGAPLSQPTRSYYLYSDEGLIAESQQPITLPLPVGEGVTATTEPTITTQYGPRPDGEFTTATLFIKTKDSAGQNTIAYYHHDHLGTPIQATDRSGIVVWSAQYNAFGKANITATEDKPTIASSLRFPGQVEDAETGLYYNWHRYYDPELGRYVTGDPIGLSGGINFYAYVGGDPVNLVDPLGLLVGRPIVRPPVRPSPLRPGPVETPIIDDYFPPIGPPYNPPTNTLPPDIFPDTTIDPVTADDIVNPDPVADETQCPSGDDCSVILAQIQNRMRELNGRYMDQCRDKKNQWATHKIEFDNKKKNLAKLIRKAESMTPPCVVPPKAYEWLQTQCPAPGTDRNTSPGY